MAKIDGILLQDGTVELEVLTTTAQDIINNKVDNTRTINGKQLNQDIELTLEDIGFVYNNTVGF